MRTLVALILVLAATGCEETVEEPTYSIDTTVALETAEAVLMLASLGVEVGHVSETPDFAFGACPGLVEDADELRADYGGGCLPGSGVTGEELSGLFELVSPATNSIAYGATEGFGFADLPVAGDFTMATQRTGDTVRVDFEIESLSWTYEGNERTLSGLYTLSVEPEFTSIDLTRAVIGRGDSAALDVEATGLVVAAGELGICPRPSGGRIELTREGEDAFAVFSESTASDGSFDVTLFDDTEGQAVIDCQPAPPPEDEEDDE